MKKLVLYGVIAIVFATLTAFCFEVDGINADETIVVGTAANFYPFACKQRGEIIGFDIDVITEVFKRLDRAIVIKDMDFDELMAEIQNGTIHVAAAGIMPTQERAKCMLLTNPHVSSSSLVIVSLKDSPVMWSDDFAHKVIAVNKGHAADEYVSMQKGIIPIRLLSSNFRDGLLVLKSNCVDAFVTAELLLRSDYCLHNSDEFIIASIENTSTCGVFAISTHCPDVHSDIQATLSAMEADGTLTEFKKKWGLL